MGIYSRDYIRESRAPSGFGGSSELWAIKFLLIANIVVFVLQNMSGQGRDPATQWLSLSLSDLCSFQIWRLVTYGFCHSSFEHIFFNLFVLWMFGRIIEPIYGSREFLALYVAGVTVSGACHVALQAIQDVPHGVVGASGGVMTVVFLTAMHFPRTRVLFMFIIPIELRWLAVMYAVADVAGLFGGGTTVAHAAHLGGAAFGVAYKHYGWRMMGLVSGFGNLRRFRFPRRRSTIHIYRPDKPIDKPQKGGTRQDLDAQVDVILSKISKHGEASLTDGERAILKEASQQYRNR